LAAGAWGGGWGGLAHGGIRTRSRSMRCRLKHFSSPLVEALS
jgi:hypothetical protein